MRHEHRHPGDLIPFDIKRLARIVQPGHRVHGDYRRKTIGAGYEYLHIAIDDHSRISFMAILPDQNHQSSMRFFPMARAFYARFGFTIQRVLPDTGPCYRDHRFRTLLFQQRVTIASPGLTPRAPTARPNASSRPPSANGPTRTCQNSEEREQQLEPWIHDYNFHRPHASLNLNTPVSRAAAGLSPGLTPGQAAEQPQALPLLEGRAAEPSSPTAATTPAPSSRVSGRWERRS